MKNNLAFNYTPHAYPTYINAFNGHNNTIKPMWHNVWLLKELTLYLGIIKTAKNKGYELDIREIRE